MKCVIKLSILLLLQYNSFECYKTKEIRVKAADTCPLVFHYFVPDRYKTQEMCHKAVDDFLPALKFVPDWFFTSKMIKKFRNVLFTDDHILLFYEDSGIVSFSSDE